VYRSGVQDRKGGRKSPLKGLQRVSLLSQCSIRGAGASASDAAGTMPGDEEGWNDVYS
jgi:hypothetical protein